MVWSMSEDKQRILTIGLNLEIVLSFDDVLLICKIGR